MQGQIEDGMLFLTSKEEEFLKFQAEVDAQNTKIFDMCSQGTLIELEPLQRKLNFQISTIKAFKKLLEKRAS